MKKLFAILCVLAMLCALCVPALAYEGLNSLAIVGSGIPGVKEWDPADPAGDMNEVEPGVFVKELSVTAGTTMKIKFAGNDAWNDAFNFGSATLEAGKTADLTCGSGSQDMTLSISKNGIIKITVNVNPMADGGAATVLVEGDAVGEAPVVTYDGYYVAGQEALVGQNWVADGVKMDEVSDGNYAVTFSDIAAGEYQFKVTVGNWDKSWGGDGPDGNYLIAVDEQSDVTIYFNADEEAISVEIVPAETEPPVTEPSEDPSTEPSEDPSVEPSEDPSEDPSVEPSEDPSEDPSVEPSEDPSEDPSVEPSEDPSEDPSVEPSEDPSEDPSVEPSEDPSEDPSVPAEDDGMVTVYAKVPASWGGANCWAWSGSTNAFESWPGNAMTLEGDWYTIQIPNWVDSIIVNWEGDANKTPDTAIEAGKDVWLVVADDNTATPFYEEPSAEDMPTTPADPSEPAPSEPAGDDTTAGADATTQPTEDPEAAAKLEAEKTAKRNKTLIILGISLLVIVGIACVLSIPKKLT